MNLLHLHILHLVLPFFITFFGTNIVDAKDTYVHTVRESSPINPDPVQSFHPTKSPPVTTIPAFPEQSYASGCPLDLPNDFFTNVKSACMGKHFSGQLRKSRCCPVLATWLYSAYSSTALGKAMHEKPLQTSSTYYDLPLLPNDSETCIDSLESGMKARGIELMKVNETCDVAYCECGIRLHPLSCNQAFSVNLEGNLVGNHRVKKLEKDCLNNVGSSGFAGCSRCLKSLQMLDKADNATTNKSEERTSQMQNEDCDQMGLTWLLAKNRSAYIHTVSAVLRATMMNSDSNSSPKSCTLNSDGMPLAVDSYEINDSSSSSSLFHSSVTLVSLSLYMVYVSTHHFFL